MDWDIVIGIETHVQLRTNSKQFSGASTAYGSEPNSQACLVSFAYPVSFFYVWVVSFTCYYLDSSVSSYS